MKKCLPTMTKLRAIPRLALAITFAISLNTAQAQVASSSWTIWSNPGTFPNTTSLNYHWNSSASGSLTMPDLSTVSVTLSGEVSSTLSTFGATSGSTMWDSYPPGTFTSVNVPSLPSNGDFVFAGGFGNPSQTLTFSRPVQNIVMNIWSLGGGGDVGSFQFDQPFLVLSQDSRPGNDFTVIGNTLSGNEASGTIEFTGEFSSFSWTVPNPEWGFGWNIGASSVSAVPEPSTLALAVMGGLGTLLLFRRRK
jgi:hypothetical protein